MPRKPNCSRQTCALLATMAEHPRVWQHGYDLSKQTGLKSGTLYPLLIRLNDQGLLDSRWEEPERQGMPPRHAYKLTPNGLAFARTQAAPGVASLVRRKAVEGSA
jgi:PadR family transcriptional regulator PadR